MLQKWQLYVTLGIENRDETMCINSEVILTLFCFMGVKYSRQIRHSHQSRKKDSIWIKLG